MADPIFDLENLRASLDEEEWAQDFNDPDGGQVRRFYLGTVMALYPSGKYYTPWACSNVTEAEVDRDSEWYVQAEAELETIGCTLDRGAGDPCDLFATEYRDDPEEEAD